MFHNKQFPKQFQHQAHSDFMPMTSAGPVRSLFVGDLSYFCTEVELAAAFSKFGPIDNLEIKRGKMGDTLMHGFIDFRSEQDAARAIKEMNGLRFMGRTLRFVANCFNYF